MLILLLLCIFLAFILQQKVYERYWNKNLNVRIHFSQSYAYEGDECSLKEEVVNDKWLPLSGLEVRLGLSKALRFKGEAMDNSNVSDQSYKRDIFALFSYKKIIRTLPFVCTKRGYYQITRSEIVGTDFFFHKEYLDDRPQTTQLYVYPKIVDARKIRLLCQAISGSMIRQNRLYPDPFEFSGIREYQKSDPMHHINWKASARSSQLLVNQFDSTTSVNLTIILDTQDHGIIKYNELTEEGIRIAASLAAQLYQQNMDLMICGNGFPEAFFLKAGTGQMAELNQRLACLNIDESTEAIQSILEKEVQKQRSEHIYVLISRNAEEIDKGVIAQLAERQNSVIWVLPVMSQNHGNLQVGRGIQILEWEVET